MIRDTLSGTYTRTALGRLTWPIAWNGTTSAETRSAEEAEIRALVSEALEALDADPDASAVEIVDGEVATTVRDEESSRP